MTKDEHIELLETLNRKLQHPHLWKLTSDNLFKLTDLETGCTFVVGYNNSYAIYWNNVLLPVNIGKLTALITEKNDEANRAKLEGLKDIYISKGELNVHK